MQIDSNGRVTWLPTQDDIGSHPVVVVAADDFGSLRLSYDLEVRPDTQAPQIQITLSQTSVPLGTPVDVPINSN